MKKDIKHNFTPKSTVLMFDLFRLNVSPCAML